MGVRDAKFGQHEVAVQAANLLVGGNSSFWTKDSQSMFTSSYWYDPCVIVGMPLALICGSQKGFDRFKLLYANSTLNPYRSGIVQHKLAASFLRPYKP